MTDGLKFFRLEGQSGSVPLDGVRMRAVIGERGMLNLTHLAKDAEVPLHRHENEQLGIVLEGSQILVVEGVEYLLRKHDAYVIPSGVEHSGRGGPDGCLEIDIFVPAREDYRPHAAEEAEIGALALS